MSGIGGKGGIAGKGSVPSGNGFASFFTSSC
jgi:hypothetical protein